MVEVAGRCGRRGGVHAGRNARWAQPPDDDRLVKVCVACRDALRRGAPWTRTRSNDSPPAR